MLRSVIMRVGCGRVCWGQSSAAWEGVAVPHSAGGPWRGNSNPNTLDKGPQFQSRPVDVQRQGQIYHSPSWKLDFYVNVGVAQFSDQLRFAFVGFGHRS